MNIQDFKFGRDRNSSGGIGRNIDIVISESSILKSILRLIITYYDSN